MVSVQQFEHAIKINISNPIAYKRDFFSKDPSLFCNNICTKKLFGLTHNLKVVYSDRNFFF